MVPQPRGLPAARHHDPGDRAPRGAGSGHAISEVEARSGWVEKMQAAPIEGDPYRFSLGEAAVEHGLVADLAGRNLLEADFHPRQRSELGATRDERLEERRRDDGNVERLALALPPVDFGFLIGTKRGVRRTCA